MADPRTDTRNAALGCAVLLLVAVALPALKLTGVVHWSWWWITAPYWFTALGAVAVAAVNVGLLLVAYLPDYLRGRRARRRL